MTIRLRHWRIGALAALLALIVRLAVPIGYMPMAGAAGLIPCPAQIAVPVAGMPMMHGMHHGAPAQEDHDAGKQSCPFAGVAAVADIAAPPMLLLLPPMPAQVAIVLPMLAMPGLGLAAPPPPKTGPPTFR